MGEIKLLITKGKS